MKRFGLHGVAGGLEVLHGDSLEREGNIVSIKKNIDGCPELVAVICLKEGYWIETELYY